MKQEIKIFIADAQPIFLSGLRLIMESQANFHIVGESINGLETFLRIQELEPDIVVLDPYLPEKNGLEIVRDLRDRNFQMKFIFLTTRNDEPSFNAAFDLGVKGYVLKDSAVTDIIEAISTVAKDKSFITPKLSPYLLDRHQVLVDFAPKIELLTPTEIKILRLIAEHKTTKEIAVELFVSPRTIDRHRYNICSKLQIRGINSLLKFAIENKSKFL